MKILFENIVCSDTIGTFSNAIESFDKIIMKSHHYTPFEKQMLVAMSSLARKSGEYW
jgi:hypothetical protein